ncbi:MAG: Uma2 family endonuclease [Planctomycetota bacterium]
MSIGPQPPQDLVGEGNYAWEIATRFPEQGAWSEADYFALLDQSGKKGFELVEGQIEVLPVPTRIHQLLTRALFLALHQFVEARQLGEVHFSGLRVRLEQDHIREPDIVYLSAARMDLAKNRAFLSADLCMEVVSGSADDRRRDYIDKKAAYAGQGIAEYWIVDPDERRVIVHRLDGEAYTVAGQHTPGDTARSVLLDGFTVDVTELFAVIEGIVD